MRAGLRRTHSADRWQRQLIAADTDTDTTSGKKIVKSLTCFTQKTCLSSQPITDSVNLTSQHRRCMILRNIFLRAKFSGWIGFFVTKHCEFVCLSLSACLHYMSQASCSDSAIHSQPHVSEPSPHVCPGPFSCAFCSCGVCLSSKPIHMRTLACSTLMSCK